MWKLAALTIALLLTFCVIAQAQEFVFYLGDPAGPDGPIHTVAIGSTIDVPVYFQALESYVAAGNVFCPIGIYNFYSDYINTDLCYFDPGGTIYGWDSKLFLNYIENSWFTEDYYGTSISWDVYCFFAIKEIMSPYDNPAFTSLVPELNVHFYVHVDDNPWLIGDTTCLMVAHGPYNYYGANACDTTGSINYSTIVLNACYTFVELVEPYQYVPGDVNMAVGQWPPHPGLSDVTYLVNYFRGLPSSQQCLINGLWASADINGDCLIVGSDVTYMVNHFRGINDIRFCPNYPPAWPSEEDAPAEMPDGWPACDE